MLKKSKSKKNDQNKYSSHTNIALDIIVRYLLILLLGFNLFIFYDIFRPLTLHATALIASLFSPVTIVSSSMLYTKGIYFEFVNACIGGSAYYLLLILCLSTKDITLKVRAKILALSFALLFVFNVLRIVILIIIVETFYFNTVHLAFWYFLSTLFVVFDWIFVSRYFKVTSVPVASDIVFLAKKSLGIKPATKEKRQKKK